MVPFNLGINPNTWMEERVQLFFDYCYPSIKNQVQKDFQWIVFFDSRTPKSFLDRIIDLDSVNLIKFMFADHWDTMDSEIIQLLNESTNSEDLIISTRLDCDDALSSTFIVEIQEKAKNLDPEKPIVLNCVNGLLLNVDNGVFYRKKIYSNAFISLVQRKQTIKESIFKYQHQTIGNHFSLIELTEADMWLQVVHGGNLLNKISGLPLIKNYSKHFNISNPRSGKNTFGKRLLVEYGKYLRIRLENSQVKLGMVIKKFKS